MKKPWLGSFEELLYEKYTTSMHIDLRWTKIKKRKCLRCDNVFRSLENRICNNCKKVNERKEEL